MGENDDKRKKERVRESEREIKTDRQSVNTAVRNICKFNTTSSLNDKTGEIENTARQDGTVLIQNRTV
jgi:hypothetical protein